jgi:hypothetical protein
VIVYCRIHGGSMGVVGPHPVGGFTQFAERSPRMRAHHMAAARLEGHDSGFYNLERWTRPTVPAAGCGDCGSRELPVKDLRAAFEAGLPKIRV